MNAIPDLVRPCQLELTSGSRILDAHTIPIPRLPLEHLPDMPGHEGGLGIIRWTLRGPQAFSMVHCQPFGEAVGAMGAVGYLDVKVGGDGKCASAKESVSPVLFGVGLLSLAKI
jgi:hypothetical protein